MSLKKLLSSQLGKSLLLLFFVLSTLFLGVGEVSAASITWKITHLTRDCVNLNRSGQEQGDGSWTYTYYTFQDPETPYVFQSGWTYPPVYYSDSESYYWTTCGPEYLATDVTFSASDGKNDGYEYSPGEAVSITNFGDSGLRSDGDSTSFLEYILLCLFCDGNYVAPDVSVYIGPGYTVQGVVIPDVWLASATNNDGWNTTTATFYAPEKPGTYPIGLAGCMDGYGCANSGINITVAATSVTSCVATTISNCSLPVTVSGSSAGSCSTGYSGSCSYTCTTATWNINSNSCTATAPGTVSAWIDVNPTNVSYLTGVTDLTWGNTGATHCYSGGAAAGWPAAGTEVPLSGPRGSTMPGNLTSTQTYTIYCKNDAGVTSPTASATVVVSGISNPVCGDNACTGYETCNSCSTDCGACAPSAPTLIFNATPTTIASGGATTLSWYPQNVTNCYASSIIWDISGAVTYEEWPGWGGNTFVSPTGGNLVQTNITGVSKINFRLYCINGYTGADTGTKFVIVNVTQPKPDLTAGAVSPTSATQGVATAFSATISNIGNLSTGVGFSNFFQVATLPNGGGTITDLAASTMSILAVWGNSITTSPAYTFSLGATPSVRACADKTNRNSVDVATGAVITESNENNNCGAWTAVTVSSATCPNGANNYSACNQCPNDLAYISSSCVPCSNGGCTGLGGSASNPLGSLVCINGANNPASCSIFTPTATLSVDDPSVDTGKSTILRWDSTNNATACVGTGFTAGGASGSRSTGVLDTAGTQNYQVVCTGAGGTSLPAFASVQVLNPSATISANPSRVRSGDTSSISWSAGGVKSCTVSGPVSPPYLASGNADNSNNFSKNSPHTATISSQLTNTFTIVCKTNGADVTKSVIVNVVPVFQEF